MDSSNKRIIPLNAAKAAAYDATAEKERNHIGARISEARQDKKLSIRALSEMLAEFGVIIGPVGVNKWELGKTVPNAYQLLAVAHALGLEEDLQFFIGGRSDLNAEGRKKLSEYKNDLIATGLYKPSEPRPKIRYVIQRIAELPVSAGPGEYLTDERFERVRFPENAVPTGADYGIRVSGDSMEPVYHDGQIVWVQECECLNPGDVGIFVYDGNGYLKVYDEQEPNEDEIEEFTDSYGEVYQQAVLVSYNENYEPIIVSPNAQFKIVGRVLPSP